MGSISYEETLGFHAARNFVSHVQEQSILPKSKFFCVILLSLANMDVKHADSIWKIMMNTTSIGMEDIFNILFDTISGVANMHCFNAQQLAVDHREEEREINREL